MTPIKLQASKVPSMPAVTTLVVIDNICCIQRVSVDDSAYAYGKRYIANLSNVNLYFDEENGAGLLRVMGIYDL